MTETPLPFERDPFAYCRRAAWLVLLLDMPALLLLVPLVWHQAPRVLSPLLFSASILAAPAQMVAVLLRQRADRKSDLSELAARGSRAARFLWLHLAVSLVVLIVCWPALMLGLDVLLYGAH